MYIWRDISAPFNMVSFKEAYIKPYGKFGIADLWVVAAFYVILISDYILPWPGADTFIFLMIIYAIYTDQKLRHYVLPSAVALLLAMFLVAAGIYTYSGSRRAFWVIPFLVPVMGWGIYDFSYFLVAKFTKHLQQEWLCFIAILLSFSGAIFYSPTMRFSESFYLPIALLEYSKGNKNDWDNLANYLSAFDNKYLLTFSRNDVFMLSDISNPYSFMNKESSKDGVTVVIPYHNTKIIFYSSYWGKSPSLQLPKDKQTQPLLKNVEYFVFLRIMDTGGNTTDDAFAAFLNCPISHKQIVTFGHQASGTENAPITIIIIPKKVYFDEIQEPYSKAHICISNMISEKF